MTSIANHQNGGQIDWIAAGLVSEMIARHNLVARNEGQVYTFRGGDTRSVIDVTFTSMEIEIREWTVNDDITLSDYQYIIFEVVPRRMTDNKTIKSTRYRAWMVKKMDSTLMRRMLKTQKLADNWTEGNCSEHMTKIVIDIVTSICNTTMPKRGNKGKRHPVY